jgi:hypothetical protein
LAFFEASREFGGDILAIYHLHLKFLAIRPGPFCFDSRTTLFTVRRRLLSVGWVNEFKGDFSIITKLFRLALLAFSATLFFIACHKNAASAAESDSHTFTETPRSAYGFVNSIGVNTHINYLDRLYGNFPLVRRELASIRILHLRDGVHLQNDDYNAMVYGRWAQLGKLGIRFNAVADPRSNLGPITPELLEKVYRLSDRTIESFEGPNEMDVSGTDNWSTVDRDFNDSLYRAVRQMKDSHQVKLIGPSMAFASHGDKVGDISGRNDFGNLHSYPAGKLPSTIFPEQTDLAKDLSGSHAIMMTESGYHNALNDHTDQPAVSENAAAKYVPRLFLENFIHGIPRTYIYELLDEAPDPSLKDNQLHWGLIRSNGTEKPAFSALKNLISELNDSTDTMHPRPLTWSLSGTKSVIDHLLLQKSNGELDLILWQEIPSFDLKRQVEISNPPATADLKLSVKAKSIRLYEPSLQEAPVRSYSESDRLSIEIPDHPLVIQILMP